MSKGKTALAIAILVVLCVATGVFGWMSIHGIDTRPFLYFFATSIGPTIALLWNNRVTAQVSDKVDQIQENTNGTLTARIQKVVREELQTNLKDEVLESPEALK
jgi:hypothetical protein